MPCMGAALEPQSRTDHPICSCPQTAGRERRSPTTAISTRDGRCWEPGGRCWVDRDNHRQVTVRRRPRVVVPRLGCVTPRLYEVGSRGCPHAHV
jgi:hypothetical protein